MHGLSLLNSEAELMRKAVLQNRMALDIIIAAQVGTCAIIETECCGYIPNNSAIVPKVFTDLHIHVKAMFDSSSSLHNWISSWFSGNGWSWWRKLLLRIPIVIMLRLFYCGDYHRYMFCINMLDKLSEQMLSRKHPILMRRPQRHLWVRKPKMRSRSPNQIVQDFYASQ